MRVLAAIAAAVVVGLVVRHRMSASNVRPEATWPAGVGLRVPHLPGSIVIDGDTDDPGWLGAPGPARTGEFSSANGAPGRPYSEARLVWGDGHLYVALYAADEDIKSRTTQPDGPLWIDDSFRMTFVRGDVEYTIEVSPNGTLTDGIRRGGGPIDHSWSSGAHVSFEMDGTINDSADMDEEWLVEMAIPLESLGMRGESGESIGLRIRRCDIPKGSARVCTSWGEDEPRGRIVLE